MLVHSLSAATLARPALKQRHGSSCATPSIDCQARCTGWVTCGSARRQPSRRSLVAAAAAAPEGDLVVGRAHLIKGGLLAAGGLLLSGAVPAQPAVAAEQVAAAAAVGQAATAALSPAAVQNLSQVVLRTLADCQLAVSVYPTFSYNAAGGGGTGSVRAAPDGRLRLTFDPASLAIPPINYQHAAILGVPVPPPLNIAIVPRRLEGWLDPETGRCELDFLASFEFTAGPLYTAAPLTVETTLTTEASDGVLRHGVGQRLSAEGRARLVGVARVPRTEDTLLNTFLQLPTDALAVLSAELDFA